MDWEHPESDTFLTPSIPFPVSLPCTPPPRPNTHIVCYKHPLWAVWWIY